MIWSYSTFDIRLYKFKIDYHYPAIIIFIYLNYDFFVILQWLWSYSMWTGMGLMSVYVLICFMFDWKLFIFPWLQRNSCCYNIVRNENTAFLKLCFFHYEKLLRKSHNLFLPNKSNFNYFLIPLLEIRMIFFQLSRISLKLIKVKGTGKINNTNLSV